MTYEETEQSVQDATKALVDAVNGISPEKVAKSILDVLHTSHRTLQQSLISALKITIEGYAASPNGTDLRNEYAKAWAKQVLALTDSPSRTMPGRLPLL